MWAILVRRITIKQKVHFDHGLRHETLIDKGVFGKFKMVVDWRKFKNKKKGACYNCGFKSHFCKKMSQEKTRLKEQIQRFFTSSHNNQNGIFGDYLKLFLQFVGMHGLLILELHNI